MRSISLMEAQLACSDCQVLLLLQDQSIKRINELLQEAGGLINIEDILPLFPDFVKIDDFKEAICQSLEEYNQQIEQLKTEMDDATRIADALRLGPLVLCLHPSYNEQSRGVLLKSYFSLKSKPSLDMHTLSCVFCCWQAWFR